MTPVAFATHGRRESRTRARDFPPDDDDNVCMHTPKCCGTGWGAVCEPPAFVSGGVCCTRSVYVTVYVSVSVCAWCVSVCVYVCLHTRAFGVENILGIFPERSDISSVRMCKRTRVDPTESSCVVFGPERKESAVSCRLVVAACVVFLVVPRLVVDVVVVVVACALSVPDCLSRVSTPPRCPRVACDCSRLVDFAPFAGG